MVVDPGLTVKDADWRQTNRDRRRRETRRVVIK